MRSVSRLKAKNEALRAKPPNIQLPTLRYKRCKKRKSMSVNPSSIARHRTASRLEFSNNPRRSPCKTTGFRTPDVGPLRTMQSVNHNAATTSMVTERRPLVQNSKIPERQTIVRPEPATTSAKPALPPPARAAQNPRGELCAVRHLDKRALPKKEWWRRLQRRFRVASKRVALGEVVGDGFCAFARASSRLDGLSSAPSKNDSSIRTETH
jgi:hypothetical protein